MTAALGPFEPIYQPVLAILQTQVNTTIPQTNIISTIKQLINAVSQFLQMCRNTKIKFLSWAYMYTTLKFLGKRVIQTNPSKFDERLFSDIYLCRLRLKQGKEIEGEEEEEEEEESRGAIYYLCNMSYVIVCI